MPSCHSLLLGIPDISLESIQTCKLYHRYCKIVTFKIQQTYPILSLLGIALPVFIFEAIHNHRSLPKYHKRRTGWLLYASICDAMVQYHKSVIYGAHVWKLPVLFCIVIVTFRINMCHFLFQLIFTKII